MPYRRPYKALGRSGLMLAATLVLAACGQPTPQTTLDPSSDSTRTIFNLTVLLFWLGVGVFVIVQAWLIVSVIKYRHRYKEQLPEQIHGNTKVEIAWTIVPAIVAIFIFVITFQAMQKIEIKPSVAAGDEVKVEVIGHQWWWEFRYPDIKTSDGQMLITANEMWVPSGKVVDLYVTSQDVIHDFWIPGLAGKRDAMPNHVTKIWFKADDVANGQQEVFWGQCAEYCGTQHGFMKMRVVVASPDDYTQWVSEQTQPAANPNVPAAFTTKTCVGCHTIRGAVNAEGKPVIGGTSGPNLTHFGGRMTIAAGTRDNTSADLSQWLQHPDSVKDGSLMGAAITKDFLTPDEVQQLVDYLLSLDPGIDAKGKGR